MEREGISSQFRQNIANHSKKVRMRKQALFQEMIPEAHAFNEKAAMKRASYNNIINHHYNNNNNNNNLLRSNTNDTPSITLFSELKDEAFTFNQKAATKRESFNRIQSDRTFFLVKQELNKKNNTKKNIILGHNNNNGHNNGHNDGGHESSSRMRSSSQERQRQRQQQHQQPRKRSSS